MYSTPLGSPTGIQKRSYVHVPGDPRVVVQRPCSGVLAGYGTGVGIAGWVYRVGNTGPRHREEPTSISQRSGPVGPAGAGVVGRCVRVGGPWYHPSGPVGVPAGPLPVPGPLESRLLANKDEN